MLAKLQAWGLAEPADSVYFAAISLPHLALSVPCTRLGLFVLLPGHVGIGDKQDGKPYIYILSGGRG